MFYKMHWYCKCRYQEVSDCWPVVVSLPSHVSKVIYSIQKSHIYMCWSQHHHYHYPEKNKGQGTILHSSSYQAQPSIVIYYDSLTKTCFLSSIAVSCNVINESSHSYIKPSMTSITSKMKSDVTGYQLRSCPQSYACKFGDIIYCNGFFLLNHIYFQEVICIFVKSSELCLPFCNINQLLHSQIKHVRISVTSKCEVRGQWLSSLSKVFS